MLMRKVTYFFFSEKKEKSHISCKSDINLIWKCDKILFQGGTLKCTKANTNWIDSLIAQMEEVNDDITLWLSASPPLCSTFFLFSFQFISPLPRRVILEWLCNLKSNDLNYSHFNSRSYIKHQIETNLSVMWHVKVAIHRYDVIRYYNHTLLQKAKNLLKK